jgi:hypothetical protein
MRHYTAIAKATYFPVWFSCIHALFDFDAVVSCNSNPYNYMFLCFELQHLKGQRGLLFTNKTKDEVLK